MALFGEEEIGFNRLATKLEEKDYGKFSRPTLSEHLRHLQEQKLVIKRTDETSKSPWKHSHYSLNYQAMSKYLPGLKESLRDRGNSWFTILEELQKRIDEVDFEDLAWEALRFIYMGDLAITKLYLESLRGKEKKELRATQNILRSACDLFLYRLYELGNKAKDEEIAKVIGQFDRQIERGNRFLRSGTID
jgi:DNA-binding HxlR family transcriptional regulator